MTMSDYRQSRGVPSDNQMSICLAKNDFRTRANEDPGTPASIKGRFEIRGAQNLRRIGAVGHVVEIASELCNKMALSDFK